MKNAFAAAKAFYYSIGLRGKKERSKEFNLDFCIIL